MSVFHEFFARREAFRATFWRGLWKRADGQPTEHTRLVLADLRRFCRAESSCVQVAKDGHVDTHLTCVLEGRREVWLRLVALLELTDEQLLKTKIGDEL